MKYMLYTFKCIVFYLFLLITLLVSSRSIAQDTNRIPDMSAYHNGHTADSIRNDQDAIIHVAYGTQSYKSLTAAVSFVSGSTLRKTPAPTLSNTLYGRLPGLTVLQGAGESGYDAPKMFIRGLSTYNDAGFLVFVDGFETSFDQLAVNEIESISVLKDAAALALYGMRGANGALVVTTKRGQTGKTKITFNARTGFQEPTRLTKFLGASDYASLYNEALVNDGLPQKYSAADLEAYKTGSDPYFHPDVNWYDEVLKKRAMLSDYSATFSGGSSSARYFVLLGYMGNEGLYANTNKNDQNSNANFKRYNFRTNIDMDLSGIFSASMDIGGRIEDRSFPNYNGPALWDNMAKYPANAYPVKNPDGSWGGNAIYPDNPVQAVLGRGFTSTHDRNLNATFRLSEKLDLITKGLKFTQAVSFNNWARSYYNKTRSRAVYEISKTETSTGIDTIYHKIGTDTDLGINEGLSDEWNRTNVEVALNYDRQYGKHSIGGMVMYHQDVLKVSGNNVPYANQNIAGRINYNYKLKYFAELGFSYSGSEAFRKGNRFGFFPSISAAWMLSEENFLKHNAVISFLKVRASAGITGNDRIIGSRFAYNQYYYYSGGYTLGKDNNWWNAIREGALGNANLSWEKSIKYNIGFDGSLFKKVDFNLDIFYEKRKGILSTTDASVPGYIGIGTPYENIGKVNNKGFEINVNYRDHIGKLSYWVGAGAWYAQNKIVFMDEIKRPYDYLYRTGHSIGQPFVLEAIGLFKDKNDIASSPLQTFAPVQPGDIKYKDQNKDGLINDEDVVSNGKSDIPELTYSTTFGAAYKGFDIELFFQGIGSRSIFESGSYFWPFINDANIAPNALGRWTPATSNNATFPRLTTLPNDNNYRTSTFWKKSGNVIRLRNIELGYSFSPHLLHNIHLTGARIFVTGVNLFTWDRIKMNDPESGSGYPPLKSYNMGIRLQF